MDTSLLPPVQLYTILRDIPNFTKTVRVPTRRWRPVIPQAHDIAGVAVRLVKQFADLEYQHQWQIENPLASKILAAAREHNAGIDDVYCVTFVKTGLVVDFKVELNA